MSVVTEKRNDANPEPDDRLRYLYLILLPDGRGYIGVSINPDNRFIVHSAPSARTLIGEAIRRHGRHNCQLKIMCAGAREYMYALERHAIIAFKTRYPAGYNLDAGGLIPEHHPTSIAKNVEANARILERERAQFREEFGVSKAQCLNYRRLQSRRPGKRPMIADLPDLDNRTARKSDPKRPWQILSRRYSPLVEPRLQLRRPGKRPMAADLPDLDNRTAQESDPKRSWQLLSRKCRVRPGADAAYGGRS